jgi:hypothetical protein
MNRRRWLLTVAVGLASGCARVRAPFEPQVAMPNPVLVTLTNDEVLWERTIDVLHDYLFEIVREDRFSRLIETQYKVGASILEPWHKETIGVANRLEGTLQSVRRRVVVAFLPHEQQAGYQMTVEAYKELEDVPGLAANSPGAATFQESRPLDVDLNPVVGQTAPSGWVPAGRDFDLEQALLRSLTAAYAA